MMSFLSELVLLLIAIVFAIFGYFIKRFMNKVDRMETELLEHKEEDLKTYATKEALRRTKLDYQVFLKELMEPVNRKLESIETHLRKQE